MTMDSKDLEAEIHPLRNEDKRLPETPGNPGHADEKLKSSPRQPRLSRCRTVVFFLSLFVCLFVVFVVSFIIPCPERPASQGMWRIDYSAAVTYDFLATEDINRDRIQDVLFLYKNANGSNNFNLSCTDEGFSSPCTFVAAVSGASGSVLWERPAAQDGALVRCSVPQTQGSRTSSACILVGRPSSFVAVDLFTGETLWSQPRGFERNTSDLSSLLQLPDVDADGAPDLLLLTQEDKEVSGYLYSGSTGRQIGHRGTLGVGGTAGSLLHVTRAGAHYILFPCPSSLCGCSVKGLHEAATGGASPLRRDLLWERMLNATPHGPLGRSPGALRHLTHVPGKAGEDLLLVTSEACVLLNGQDLTPRWTFRTAQVFRKPILGHYKPDTPAVVIENGTGTDRQILLLDLGSGAVLWSQALRGLPGDPQSASLPTADHRSAFFFWGLHELSELSSTNQTRPQDAQHSLYMFHPTLPGVLLELANISANIVAFQAVLFEPSRHAACVLLMGPAGPDTPGTVSVAKHKVQDLVPGSRVVRLAEGGPDSDQAVPAYTIELLDTMALNLHRIDKDVQRCDRNYWYFTTPNLERLRDIMCSYVWEHLDIGYVQGMCDLLAPLLVILDNDQLAYSCFSHLMKRMSQNFPNGGAMDTHFANMRSLIQILDSELFELMHQNGDYTHFYFCYRWFLLDFKRELVYEDVFAVWEVIWAARHISSEHFVLFIALALVEAYREIIRDNNMDFTDIIKFFNERAEHHDAQEILQIARDLVHKVQMLIENK